MDNDIKGAMTLAFLSGLMIGVAVCGFVVNATWKYWALENNHAHYDQQTGAFVLEEPRL